jgi:ferredoxin
MELLTDLAPLVAELRAQGYRLVGPTMRDGAIVLADLDSAAQLPHGWEVEASPGRYQLRRRNDTAAFAHSAGPQSWKQFLHPPRQALWSADRDAGETDFVVHEPPADPAPLALIGVRGCDLRAIAVQLRVFGPDSDYARRLTAAFIVAVNCTEPAGTCFCVSAGGGPRAGDGYDLALTELAGDGRIRYVVEVGSAAGGALLGRLPYADADPADVLSANEKIAAAEGAMGRALPDADLPGVLAASVESPHWQDVASRCLTCGNCTMVCPTCFCTSVVDTTDVTGEHAQRWQEWASCFDLDYSELHGGQVRTSGASRYRQWLTHKFGTWHTQFGESGCVGCGRCIAWCPVGIDVTAELSALATTSVLGEPQAAVS